jgi:hypothetical protein
VIKRATALLWLFGVVLLLAAFHTAREIIFIGGGAAVVYVGSLILHPDRDCRKCGGTGRHRSWMFGWARRQCHRCAGQGRHRRFGNMILNPGRDVLAERLANRAKERRNLPRA